MAEEKTPQSMNEAYRELGENVREEVSKGTLGETVGRGTGKMVDQGAGLIAEGVKGNVRAFNEGAKTVGSGIKGLADRVGGGIKDDFEDIKEAKGPVGKVQAGMSAASNFFLPTAMMKAGSHITGLDKVEDKLRDGFDNTVIKAAGGEVPSEKKTPEKSDEGFAHRPAPKVGEQSEGLNIPGGIREIREDMERDKSTTLKGLDQETRNQMAETLKNKPEDFFSLADEVFNKAEHDKKLKDVGKGVNDAVKNSGKDDMEPIRPEKDSSNDMGRSKESSAMKLDGPEIG